MVPISSLLPCVGVLRKLQKEIDTALHRSQLDYSNGNVSWPKAERRFPYLTDFNIVLRTSSPVILKMTGPLGETRQPGNQVYPLLRDE